MCQYFFGELNYLHHYFEQIKKIRFEKGLTQKAVADLLGMTTNAYQKYEYGDREPNMAVFITLADYFGVSLDYLVGRTDNPEINQ